MGSNLIWLVSLQEEEMWTHKETWGTAAHWEETVWRHSERVAAYKPGREASEETKPASNLDVELKLQI